MLTKEQLMMPRYKVIAPWPGMESTGFEVRQVVSLDKLLGEAHPMYEYENCQGTQYFVLDFFKKYSNLFKELMWWHLRSKDDLPTHIGVLNENKEWIWIAPVVKWDELREQECGYCTISFTNLNGEYEEISSGIWDHTAADESEYNEYINQKQK